MVHIIDNYVIVNSHSNIMFKIIVDKIYKIFELIIIIIIKLIINDKIN